LSCRIPDLQFDSLPIQLDGPDLEINPDCGDKGRREGVFAESQKAAGFPYTTVANQQQFDLFENLSFGALTNISPLCGSYQEVIVPCPCHGNCGGRSEEEPEC
jgi:hypothetical protein